MAYYLFYLEIALTDQNDTNIYAYENISHIPTEKLLELFNIDLAKDPMIVDGYFLTEEIYTQNKEYIDSAMQLPLNFNVFEYCLRQYGAKEFSDIRKMYKEDLFE